MKETRLKKEDFERDIVKPQKAEAQRKPILVASNGSLKGLLSPQSQSSVLIAQVTNQPTPDDLAENIEVQFTPEIIAKAQELGNNPVKIYNWVRNNIEFVPTYGSIQGAHMTLLTKQGNAFDTASLLIALLRSSNIPARYVYGTIELPIDKVMNWVGGFTDANAALDFIASGGIPVTGIISGGKVTKARLEHVWVEAWIDYIPSRGAKHKTGQGDTWTPVDGSFKQYTYKNGMDLYNYLSFNAFNFINAYITDLQEITPYQQYGREMLAWLDTNAPNAAIEDILGDQDIRSTKVIVLQTFPFLLGTLPYNLIAKAGCYSQLPDNIRRKITFDISTDIFREDGVTVTKSLLELSGKRVTLSYIPATDNDEILVARYGGDMLNVPPYLLNLKPILKVEGVDVAIGSTIGMGSTQMFTMTFSIPGYGTDMVQNTISVGTYSAITLRPQKTTVDIVSTRMEMLTNNSKNIDMVTLDDLLGEFLYNIGLSYFHRLTFEDDFFAKTFQMVYIKQNSEALTTLNLNISYLFGIPNSVSQGGLSIDVDRDVYTSASLTGDTERVAQFGILSGMASSACEHMVFEKFLNIPSVSAVRLLKYASKQGVPIYTIDSSNVNTLLQNLQVSLDVKAEIQNAVNSGKKVVISQTELQFYEWKGVGYIIFDPLTGSGAYMIDGGLAGGGTAKKSPLSLRQKGSFTELFIGMMKRAAATFNAILEIGTLYKMGSKDPVTGYIDCSGLVSHSYSEVGIKELGTPSSPKNAQSQYNYVESIGGITNDPKIGDLVFFQGTYDKNNDGVVDNNDGVTHVGIYIGDNQYIAAQQSRGVDIYNPN